MPLICWGWIVRLGVGGGAATRTWLTRKGVALVGTIQLSVQAGVLFDG
jgi:hypothetical protein